MRVSAVAVSFLCACGPAGSVAPPPPETCPSWPTGTSLATGPFSIAAPDASIAGTWLVGVEAAGDLLTVRGCIIEMFELESPPAGVDRWWPWEKWVFAGTWRLSGSVDTRTKIAGATLAGTPGMSGGFSRREISCDGKSCKNAVVEDWLFFQNGASELFVDRWDPLSRSLGSSGWVLTDAKARQVDLSFSLSW